MICQRRRPGRHAAWLLCAAILAASPAPAQIEELRLPISLDADSTDYDGKTSMLMFQGLRLTQGNIGVQADTGRASKLDFEDSVWQFSGRVVIDTESGHIECDAADLRFKGHQLLRATITGSPATFEMRRPDSDEVTYAQAGSLDYDFAAGVVEFSNDAVITEGGNQISSNYLVYNIREQRINAQSGGNGDPRVKITYTPRAVPADSSGADGAPGPDAETDAGPGAEPDEGAEAVDEPDAGTIEPRGPGDGGQ